MNFTSQPSRRSKNNCQIFYERPDSSAFEIKYFNLEMLKGWAPFERRMIICSPDAPWYRDLLLSEKRIVFCRSAHFQLILQLIDFFG